MKIPQTLSPNPYLRLATVSQPTTESVAAETGNEQVETFTPSELGSSPPAPPKGPGVELLLERMRPYLREVHVVSPPQGGAPPILSGSGAENQVFIPEHLRGLPGQRWTVTPRIEAAHARDMQAADNQTLRSEDHELKQFVAPILAQRYGLDEGKVIVELGPSTNTDLAAAYQNGGKNLYFGMDISKPLLEKNRELMNEPGFLIPNAYQVYGDTYRMPFHDNVSDRVCVSCHPPFVSATPEDKIKALAEVKRVLKPGGEFALFPWYEDKKHPDVNAFLHSQFEVQESHESPLQAGRKLLILKARDS